MKLNVSQYFQGVDEQKEYEFSLDLSHVEIDGNSPFKSPVKIKAIIDSRIRIVTLKLMIECDANLICDRCLGEYEQGYSFTYDATLVSDANSVGFDEETNEEYLLVVDDEIDIEEIVTDIVLLGLPTKMICSEDCKGLCFTCGHNLNESDCKCEHD